MKLGGIKMENELLNALDSVTWYNSWGEVINSLKDYINNYKPKSKYDTIPWPKDILGEYNCDHFPRIIWFLMVEMFGDCGTSPRVGWIDIDKRDEAIVFLENISKTYNECGEPI